MNTSMMRNPSLLVDLSDSSDEMGRSSTLRSRRRSRGSASNFSIVPPYTGRAEYRFLVVDLEDVEFDSLTTDIPAEPEVILKAIVHYVLHDDDYYLSRLLDEFIPESDVGRATHALDQWFFVYLDQIERIFSVMERVAPMRINHATLKGRFAKLECTYEEFIIA